MLKYLPFTLTTLLFSCFLTAQTTITWDGGGATTDWQEQENWDGDVVPTAVDVAVFNTNVTVTGTAPAAPVQLILSDGAQVVFDLDLTIGDGTTAGNAVELQTGARFVIENGRTFTLLPESGSNGLNIGSGADNVNVNIKGSAALNITGGNHGINVANATASFIQRGTTSISSPGVHGVRLAAGDFTNLGALIITGAGTNGIDNSATFSNQTSSTTSILIDDAVSNGIKNKAGATFTNQKDITINNTSGVTTDGVSSEGTWTNEASGSIVVNGMEDDGVEAAGGSFANDGSISVTLKATAMSGNGGVVIGTDSEVVTFTNTSNNSIFVDGGSSGGRDIIVAGMGDLNNTGTITLSGGDDGARFFNDGNFTNDLQGTLDLTDGRVNSSGTLTNNGLIISTRGGSGIFSTGTANNNAFFKYDGSNSFANGSGGGDDLGISLNQFSERVLDLDGGNEVDIAEVSYVWTYNGAPIGTSDATGFLTVDCAAIDDDTINVRPEGLDLGSDPIRLRAVCNPALPVELTSLVAVNMPKSIMIKWRTATEIASDYMAVERSSTGGTFVEIGRVSSAGYSEIEQQYELEDTAPLSGTNLYRLRQVDVDGTTVYSEVVAAEFVGNLTESSSELLVFPTVISAGQVLSVDLRHLQFGSIQAFRVVDTNGRSMKTFQLNGGEIGAVSQLPQRSGIYFLVNEDQAGRTSTRFIIR